MPPAPRPDAHGITLPQVMALIAIWTPVIDGLTAQRPPDGEQISLKAKAPIPACAAKES